MTTSEKEVQPVGSQPRLDLSLSHHSPAQRVTSVLLNGQNFAAWSRSLRLYLGGRGKLSWLSDKEPKPAETDAQRAQWDMDNYTILGWLYNYMESRIYQMFMYHESVHGLWKALTKMYAHSHNASRIFELH